MSMASANRRVSQPRGALSRRVILGVALELVDECGPAGLTMRALAARVGCARMALYSHVRSRDDVVLGIIELMIKELVARPIAGDTWQQYLRRRADDYKAVATRHQRAFELLALARTDAPPLTAHIARALGHLRELGLSPLAAEECFAVADAFASGFLLMQTRALVGSGASNSGDESPGEEQAPLSGLLESSHYERGFDLLILGLEHSPR